MLAKYEFRKYAGEEQVWLGRYKNLTNLPHWHHDCEMIYAERGKAIIFVNGQEFTLPQGRTAFVAGDSLHYIRAEKESILCVLLYDSVLTEKITSRKRLLSPLLSGNYPIRETLARIERELKEKKEFYEMAVNRLLSLLILDFFRGEKCEPSTKKNSLHDRYKELLTEIDNRISYFTFENAVEFMGYSPQYFSRRFHEVFGMTFANYLNTARVEKAVSLLQENKKISAMEIAAQSGFDTIRNYNRIFKKITGFTPGKLPENFNLLKLRVADASTSFDPTDETAELITE